MRIFLAGATGVVGSRLVPLLREAGHLVIGTPRSPEKAEHLRAQGVQAELLDCEPRARTTSWPLRVEAIRYLEGALQAAEGIDTMALRFGWFYGPRTSLGRGGRGEPLLDAIRRRRMPIVGSLTGIWSFLHIADAAAATVAAIQHGATGISNAPDDDPAPVREWLPFLANAIGAPPPRRVPAWLATLAIGPHGVVLMNENRGCSNKKAKSALGWHPRYASWRTGFVDGLG
jgi:nucleoside-diphosphate-sugar epimerase